MAKLRILKMYQDFRMRLLLGVLACCLMALGASEKSVCEKRREMELMARTGMRLLIQCKADGSFDALQCYERRLPSYWPRAWCMCWRPDGSQVAKASTDIETCECHMHRDRELNKSEAGLVGNFVPRCDDSGFYSPKQCHGSTGLCWCADKHGNRLTEGVRGELNC